MRWKGKIANAHMYAELEPLLEDERHGRYYRNLVQSGSRTPGSGSHVSPIDAILQLGPGWCRAVYWRVYPGAGVQQFLLVGGLSLSP